MFLFKRMVSDNVKFYFFLIYTIFCASCFFPLGSSISVEHFNIKTTSTSGYHVMDKDVIHNKNVSSAENLNKNFTSTGNVTERNCNETNNSFECNKQSTKQATDTEVKDLTKEVHSTTPLSHVSNLPAMNNSQINDKLNIVIDNMPPSGIKASNRKYFNTTAGTIAALICLSLAVFSYVGIMVWKNVIQRRYQNREILLNEDDLGDINDEDMRHFEAACIQIEG